MAEFLSEVNVKHVLVTPSILKKLTDAVFAVNTARQSATQEYQFLLVYGREPNAPADNLIPWSVAKPESTRACVRRVDKVRKTVRYVLLTKQQKTNKRMDAMRQRATEYALVIWCWCGEISQRKDSRRSLCGSSSVRSKSSFKLPQRPIKFKTSHRQEENWPEGFTPMFAR